jgi:Flp pilus assembly protein TadG
VAHPLIIAMPTSKSLVRRFADDQSGSHVIIFALLLPVLVGAAGLGTEAGWWSYKHKNMQSAADSGATSAATAGTNLTSEANSVTATYGYANGVSNVTVTVNQPPTTGNYISNPQAVEAIVGSRKRGCCRRCSACPVLITARAVAVPNAGTAVCSRLTLLPARCKCERQ